MGYGETRRQVKQIAEAVARETGLLQSTCVTDGWWRRFTERQKDLTLRRGDATAHVRMDAVNRKAIKGYYAILKDTLEAHDLMDRPLPCTALQHG